MVILLTVLKMNNIIFPNFDRIYYEENIEKYPLGKMLLNKYQNIEKHKITSHNNIEELRKYENKDFTKLKDYLIIGARKTHKYTENHKISDYLVPFTSSGCYVYVLLSSL